MRRAHTIIVLTVVLGATTPAAAQDRPQVRSFGSTLAAPPNTAFGCELRPTLDQNFVYSPAASGAADCTWRQAGVFGDTAGADPRFSSVPGDGVITQAQVRSGPNPAPLRFVVFSQLGNTGGTQPTQCCFFVSETAPVALTPNAITTIPLNIPVQRNTLRGIRRFDLLGVSATTGTGTLPISEVGPHDAFSYTQPGAVNAGWFYPRLGAVANDSGGGRPEDGGPGFELLVRWTWRGIAPLPRVDARTAAVAQQRARLQLSCAAGNGSACAGLVQLRRRTGASATTTYGSARYTIAPGASARVSVKLNAAGRRLLRSRRRVTVTLRITPTGGAARSSALALRR